MHRDCVYCMKLIIIEFMGKNLKMCTNAYFFEKKSELSELHYIFNLLEAKKLYYLDLKYC